jgi:CheY-like chemotaxis protein
MDIRNVLLLEDEPFIALDIEDMLRELGAASVTTFDTRAEGIKWLTANTPDLAIVDPRLNDGVCLDVVETLLSAEVPFVVYSGAAVDDDASDAFARGTWIDKPTTPQLFRETVQRVLARESV